MWWSAVLLLCLSPVISWARGGGGCLAEGTLVLTPDGSGCHRKAEEGRPCLERRGGEA